MLHAHDAGKVIEERDKYGQVVRKYLQGKLLGKGGFAKCYQVTDLETREELAVKVIDKASLTKPKTKHKLRSEIKIHSSMNHPNLVQYKGCFEDDLNVYILLELCTEQTLMEHSKRKRRFTETEVSYLIHQCLQGIYYMHNNSVIHRDLKLSNLLLNARMEVKIADFGLATQLDYDGERKRTICGTPNYIAPEILEGSHRGHSFEVDIWSLGVIMFTLLVGKPPFEMSDMKSTYKKIRQVSYSFPPDLYISSEARNLIRRILQADPLKRPNLSEVEHDAFFRIHLPTPLAPLSLFQPGTTNYITHERRLLDAGLLKKEDRYSMGGRRVSSVGRSPLSHLDGNRVSSTRASSITRMSTRAGSTTTSHVPVKTPQQYPPATYKDPFSAWSPSYRSSSASSPRSSAKPYTSEVKKYGSLSPPTLQGADRERGHLPPPSLSTSPSSLSPYSATRSSTTAKAADVFSPPHYKAQSPSSGTSPQRFATAHRQLYTSPGSPDFAAAVPMRSPSLGGMMGVGAGVRSPSSVTTATTTTTTRSPSQPYQYAAAVAPPQIPTPTRRSHSIPVQQTPPQATPLPASASEPKHHEDEEDKEITLMHNNLEKTVNGIEVERPYEPQGRDLFEKGTEQVSITCYSDFTDKYGLCYLMNNENVGVHFNDSTKMVWDAVTNKVQYVARGKAGINGQPAEEEKLHCAIDDYPDWLKKKITLISYFKNYLTRQRNPKDYRQYEVVQCSKGKASVPSSLTDLVYVKRWSKTRYAIIFRLSNKSVQVSFFDGTEILLFSEARQVTYTDELGNASTFALTSMLTHPKPEIAQRLKYTKEIINRLINKA